MKCCNDHERYFYSQEDRYDDDEHEGCTVGITLPLVSCTIRCSAKYIVKTYRYLALKHILN